MKNNFTFPKEEKLKSRKLISKIFSDGFVVKSFPLRIQFIYHDIENFPPCQLGVSVPKRNFKSAVDRNRIKRQIKEAYRLNKSLLIEKLTINDKQLAMMIIFSGREFQTYENIEINLKKSLSKIKI